MSKGIPVLIVAMLGLGGLVSWAGQAGVGVKSPKKEPVSVREGSAHIGTAGHHRTRYFMGGGIHHGK